MSSTLRFRLLCCAAVAALCSPALSRPAEEGGKPLGKLPPDLKLVPRDAAFFASYRLSELVEAPLVKALLAGGPSGEINRFLDRLGPAKNVERLTVASRRPGQGPVVIVRAHKPYRLEELKTLAGASVKATASGKEFYHAARLSPGASAVWPVDERTFVLADLDAMVPYLATQEKAAATHPLADELQAAAGKHAITLAGLPSFAARVDSAWRQRRSKDRPRPPAGLERFKERPLKLKSLKDTFEEMEEHDLAFAGLARPLLRCRRVLVTADVGAELRADLKATFASEDEAKDGQAYARMGLIVLRQGVPLYFRELGQGTTPPPISGLVTSLQGLARSVKVGRSGKVVAASLQGKLDGKALAAFNAFVEEQLPVIRQTNNLKQVAIAIHNYEASNGFLPDDIRDAKGKALLSWRVEILPYIEQELIYKQLKRDEPWDSPHNKKVLATMPEIYAPVRGKTPESGMTYIQRFTGPGTLWDGKRVRPRLIQITDGLTNTLMVAEAGKAVHWAKPDDMKVTAKGLPRLGGQFPKVFFAAFFDGSVKKLRRDMDEKVLRLLIDPADGKAVPPLKP